jgi:hypothetical protein
VFTETGSYRAAHRVREWPAAEFFRLLQREQETEQSLKTRQGYSSGNVLSSFVSSLRLSGVESVSTVFMER